MNDDLSRRGTNGHRIGIRRTYRIDRATAEALLSNAQGARRRAGPLGDLLTAVAAPARPEELVGGSAAMAAFRSACSRRAADRPGRSTIKGQLTRLFTVKVAALAVAAATGGIALAATSGALPNPLKDEPAVTVSNGPRTGRPSGVSPHTTRTGPGVLPSPALFGLCGAYEAGADHRRSLADPAFTALVTAAGGVDKVDDYCKALLAAPSPGADPRTASSAAGTQHPTAPPTEPPNGPPTQHPTGPPASHPGH
jgi:hypothetical protein